MTPNQYHSGDAAPPPLGRFGWSMVALFVLAAVFLLYPTIVVFIERTPSRFEGLRLQTQRQMSNLIAALRQYQTEYEQFPSGSPATILSQLKGDNPKRIVFLETSEREVSNAGELIDPWGRPYHLTVDENGQPLVYSNGPDKRDDGGAETTDDLVSWR